MRKSRARTGKRPRTRRKTGKRLRTRKRVRKRGQIGGGDEEGGGAEGGDEEGGGAGGGDEGSKQIEQVKALVKGLGTTSHDIQDIVAGIVGELRIGVRFREICTQLSDKSDPEQSIISLRTFLKDPINAEYVKKQAYDITGILSLLAFSDESLRSELLTVLNEFTKDKDILKSRDTGDSPDDGIREMISGFVGMYLDSKSDAE